MTWHGPEDYERLLRRRHKATEEARRARMRMSALHRFAANTLATHQVRAELRRRARRLERERAALDRRLESAA